jgi:division protein CdvB (Snf7/Vps24/ESCRT-III family)
LFSSDKRKIRIELFGSYLSKSFVLETVLTNTDNNIKELGSQLSNLKLLKDELEKQVAEKKAKKMLEDVEKMSEDDAQALFNQLKVKLGQQ